MSVPASILACYRTADAIAQKGYPYVFGGGHPGFGPDNGGYDCSGAVSAVLHGGGILGHPGGALGTHELERWGLSGEGRWMTVWVINHPDIEHTFIEFKIPGRHRWFAARHTGTIVGWAPFTLSTDGYVARRRP